MEFTQDAIRLLKERYILTNDNNCEENSTKRILEIGVMIRSSKCFSKDYRTKLEEYVIELLYSLMEDNNLEPTILISSEDNNTHIEAYYSIKENNIFRQKDFENKEKVKFKTRFKEKISPWFKKLMNMLIAEGLKKIVLNLIDSIMKIEFALDQYRIIRV